MAQLRPVKKSRHFSKPGLPGSRAFVLIMVALALLVAFVYLPVAWNGFVDYDDGDYVTANSRVQLGLTWANVSWAFMTGHASNWHPLTWLSHMLDWNLFGDWAGGHHLVSLGLHLANTVLLFAFLCRTTGQTWRSAMVAALFGLHPLHVESVAWVAERKDVLSTLFFLLSLSAYTEFARPRLLTSSPRSSRSSATQVQREKGPGRGWLWYAVALFFFALGLMSKPMLVTLPFVLLLMDFWPLERIGLAELGLRSVQFWRRAGILAAEKLPFFALSIGSSVVTFLVQRHGGSVSTSLSLDARIANAVVAYSRYLQKTFFPADLSVLYPHPGHWPVWRIVFAAVLLGAITALVLLAAKKRPYAPVGWLWFVGTLIPVIGLVQVGVQSMADRYTYIPLIGIFVALVWWLGDYGITRPPLMRVAAPLCVAVIGACCWLTVKQVLLWRDSAALFSHAARVTDQNYLAYNNLGYYYSKIGKPAEAAENYQKSLAIKPDYEEALNNMGHALAGRKRFREALDYYYAALRVRPNQPEVLNNLGNALSELGKLDEAIGYYRKALQVEPDHADAHNNLGVALAMQGKFDEAIAELREVTRLKPRYASAYSNLGNAYAVRGKLDEAIVQYREALGLNPNDAQSHNNLGNVLAQKGKVDDAVQHYMEAIRLNADNPEAHYNLSRVLQTQGKLPEAISHVTEALRLRPDYPDAQRQLEALRAQSPR